MDLSTATARLKRITAATVVPVLDDPTVTDLLLQAQRPDANGRPPSDPAWTPTWDLAYAAAEGWAAKAAAAAAMYDVSADGATFRKSSVADACLKQESYWRARIGSYLGTDAAGTNSPSFANPINIGRDPVLPWGNG